MIRGHKELVKLQQYYKAMRREPDPLVRFVSRNVSRAWNMIRKRNALRSSGEFECKGDHT